MKDIEPNIRTRSIHERKGYMAERDLAPDQLDEARELSTEIPTPVLNVLKRVDVFNDEIQALSYLANEAWRLAFKAGENPATDEHSFYLAPVIRRISYLSSEISSLLYNIDIDTACGSEYRAAL
ncbi:hypothetical protein Nham_1610 [Nitrobacter hamburgensis X14]|uniref:Uncharacterized protein n=2 Tax=Nitrobacter hamburgensis TaxID=912 RepID=Q1QMW8_NITHX|nr:hypothetical protein Nham_1610 [Nitrobacter hamburgensis X14]